MDKIVIDEKVCLKHRMTVKEVLIALAVRDLDSTATLEGNLDNMVSREILVQRKDDFTVTQRWSEVIDEILADSSGRQDDDRLRNLATEMRKIYPEGRMIDRRTGQPTSYYFRCNVGEVSRKLKTFFSRYGDFPDDAILDATRRYVASYRGNYQQLGFRQLKYFILKDSVRQGPDGNYVEPLSPLLDFLENKEGDGEGVVINDNILDVLV